MTMETEDDADGTQNKSIQTTQLGEQTVQCVSTWRIQPVNNVHAMCRGTETTRCAPAHQKCFYGVGVLYCDKKKKKKKKYPQPPVKARTC